MFGLNESYLELISKQFTQLKFHFMVMISKRYKVLLLFSTKNNTAVQKTIYIIDTNAGATLLYAVF